MIHCANLSLIPNYDYGQTVLVSILKSYSIEGTGIIDSIKFSEQGVFYDVLMDDGRILYDIPEINLA